jgi:hypothetical protein
MTGWWINEWRAGRTDVSVVCLLLTPQDFMVVVLGFGFGVAW